MFPSSSRGLLVTLAAAQAALGSSHVDDTDCDCFLTNGSNPKYFTEHKFFDFRSLPQYASVPDPITTRSKTSSAPPTSKYFESDDWTSVWDLQAWDNSEGGRKLAEDATILMVNSPNNVYIQKSDDDDTSSDTFMTMRTKHMPGFQTAAEFDSVSNDYHFLSIRMLARTIGDPGAVTAVFTYRDSKTLAGIQEADIEILTSDPTDRIQYTNQPSYTADGDDIPAATRNVTIPRSWNDWAVHRIDWTPERTIWYVDGAEMTSIKYQTPRDPSGIIFNAWSDGGSWSGNMSLNNEALQQIQWIEMVYNTTKSNERRSGTEPSPDGRLPRRASDEGCRVVCSIDKTDETGKATVLWDSAAPSVRASGSACLITWIWGVITGVTILVSLVL